jgi:glycosyltransferase involved in cell wall biosynthesis
MSSDDSFTPRIVITYPYPLGRPSGGARMTFEIARHLGRAGARVTLVPVSATVDGSVPRRAIEPDKQGRELDEVLGRDGVDVVRVDPHVLHRTLDGLGVRRAVRNILDREHVDFVLSYFCEAAFLPELLRSRGVHFGFISAWQTYIGALNLESRWLPRSVSRKLRSRFLGSPHRAAEVLFASSGSTKGELVSELGVDPSRVDICYLGVDPVFLDVPRAKPDAITRLLFFGRIVPTKGVMDAIRALGKLAAQGHRDFTFRLRGMGEHEWARRAAAEAGIADHVEALGPAKDEELRRELEEAHLVIMPSRHEAFGLAFAEAQAAGLPVVAYRAGSIPEVVEDGVSGWLAPLGDVDGLAACIAGALEDPERTYAAGVAGRERAGRLFRWERTAETILGGVRRVMNGSEGRVS